LEKRLLEDQRKQIFEALVGAQDQGMTVPQSIKLVAERFGVTEGQLRQIEQEGLTNDWPPL
jgi:DNA-directed RNA polymerase sigma subunit (sigma70/sigma32)